MSKLIKRTFVARKHDYQPSQRFVFFQFGPDKDTNREGVFLTRKNWDEMGQPEVVTITVELGDTLNEISRERNTLDKAPKYEVPLTNTDIPRMSAID